MTRSPEAVEKTVEFLIGELGDVTLALRPNLPIVAEGFRFDAKGHIQVFGQGRKISFPIPEDALETCQRADQILLCEFGASGETPERELILSRFP